MKKNIKKDLRKVKSVDRGFKPKFAKVVKKFGVNNFANLCGVSYPSISRLLSSDADFTDKMATLISSVAEFGLTFDALKSMNKRSKKAAMPVSEEKKTLAAVKKSPTKKAASKKAVSKKTKGKVVAKAKPKVKSKPIAKKSKAKTKPKSKKSKAV